MLLQTHMICGRIEIQAGKNKNQLGRHLAWPELPALLPAQLNCQALVVLSAVVLWTTTTPTATRSPVVVVVVV